jgi:hypothetical protein
MMNTAELQREFKRKVSNEIDVEREGIDRYIVYTPFMFDDGDHFVIVLKKRDNEWRFTDEGHTFMHMSYGEIDLSQGTRKSIIDQVLLSFRLANDAGELCLAVPDDQYGDALFSFVQALMKISDTAYWTRERVRSTFMEDFRTFLEEKIPSQRRTFDFCDKQRDPDEIYPVDCKVNGMARPLMVFGIHNDAKCRDATITLLQFEKWGEQFRSMAIFEDQTQINNKVLARFSDVAEKLFSSLGTRDRTEKYLSEVLGGS